MKISVGIIGVTGYAGQELLKILCAHPSVSVDYCGSRQLERASPVEDLLPAFRGRQAGTIHPFQWKKALEASDLLFLALPHGVAMEMVPKILKKPTAKVIDLSGDFRLKSASVYEKAYRTAHTASHFLAQASYGLPEWERDRIRSSRLVANPGCYPTAALLGLSPLSAAGLLSSEGTIINAASGVTGAGRSVTQDLLFTEVNEDFRAYKVNAHQHIPEMEQQLTGTANVSIRVTFIPHLAPMNRGIYATIYVPLKKSVSEAGLRSVYEKRYDKEPFIRMLPSGQWPSVRAVERTNFCDIGIRLDARSRRAIIVVAIDNLVKGAAGQAVQNMNILYGLDETTGLMS